MYFGKYVNEKGQDTQDCCYQTCHLKIAIKARGDLVTSWPGPFPTSGSWLVTAAEWAQQIHHFHLSLSCCWSRNLRSSELRIDLGATTDTHLDMIYPSSFQCCCPLAFLIQMFKDRLDQFFITHAKYTFLSVSFFVKPGT